MRNDHETTRKLLFFCYTCPDARRCETVSRCEACWDETEAALTAVADETADRLECARPAGTTTEALLRAYAW